MYQRRYETLLLVDPELAEDGLEQFKQKLFDIMEKDNGRLIQEENWGRRRLAYPVKKQMYGVYYLMDYMGSPELLAELERNLRIDERVFKYMTQVLDKHFTEEKFEKALEQLQLEKARQEAESAEAEKRAMASNFDEEEEESGEPEPQKAAASEEAAPPVNEAPAEASAETPAEAPTEAPVEAPVEAPTEAPAEEPAEKPAEAAEETPSEEPVKD